MTMMQPTIERAFDPFETLSILLHAGSKIGKTTLASTAPPPLLIFDAEGGSKFLPFRKTFWDPTRYGPPVYDGTWDVCVVQVRDFETLRLAYQYLNYGGHPFRSISLDSISEMQRRCKKAIVGTEQMKMQQWGELLMKMDDLIRGFRDLTMHPTCPVQVVIFIAETRENQKGKYVPYMQGQISIALPYWMDVVGYLYVEQVPTQDPAQPVIEMRRLLVSPHPQFEAGERVQGRLGKVVDEPNIMNILTAIYPQQIAAYQPQP